jgi:hypothetical protein
LTRISGILRCSSPARERHATGVPSSVPWNRRTGFLGSWARIGRDIPRAVGRPWTAENRGVPSSSLGLAIKHGPAAGRAVSFSEPGSRRMWRNPPGMKPSRTRRHRRGLRRLGTCQSGTLGGLHPVRHPLGHVDRVGCDAGGSARVRGPAPSHLGRGAHWAHRDRAPLRPPRVNARPTVALAGAKPKLGASVTPAAGSREHC